MRGPQKDVKDRSLISLSWPLILTFAVGMIQPMMDSWFLSRTSETAAAGVGAMLPILGALFTALHAFAQSGASIVSQYIGAKQNSHANSTQTMVLFGSILLGVALTLVIFPLSGHIPQWMGLTEEPAKYAMMFLSVVSFGFAFRALQTILTALIATHGLTVWNLVGNTLTIASNAALNVVFLEGLFGLPKMGVYGVALATALSWLISSGILWMVLKFKVKHQSRARDWKRSRILLPDWIRIGLPAAAEPISFQLFQVFITAMVVYVGTTAMTARVFAGNFAALSVILGVGLGSGNQILVAHLVGPRGRARLRKGEPPRLPDARRGHHERAIALDNRRPFGRAPATALHRQSRSSQARENLPLVRRSRTAVQGGELHPHHIAQGRGRFQVPRYCRERHDVDARACDFAYPRVCRGARPPRPLARHGKRRILPLVREHLALA